MPSDDLQIRIPIPHDYFRSYSVQQSIHAERDEQSRKLTEFRGYVVSRGFDTENVVSEILRHLLFLNRPKYEDETEDEFLFYLHCRSFVRQDMLTGRAFGFGRKIEFANEILTWIPKALKINITLPIRELKEAVRWRNAFAHDRIEFTISGKTSLVPILQERRGRKLVAFELSQENLSVVAHAMECCYDACRQLEEKLCVRFGDARAKPT